MLRLEVFETPEQVDDAAYLDPKSAEAMRDAAFEQGYGAGWQDALAQMRDEDALRRAATFDAVQALSFTFAEAREMAEAQLVALTEALLASLVPQACALSVPGRVAQELRHMLARDADAQVQVLCAPDSVALLQPVLDDLPPSAPVTLVAEPSFAAEQVVLRGHAQQRRIDLAALADLLRAAFTATTATATPATPATPAATAAPSPTSRPSRSGSSTNRRRGIWSPG